MTPECETKKNKGESTLSSEAVKKYITILSIPYKVVKFHLERFNRLASFSEKFKGASVSLSLCNSELGHFLLLTCYHSERQQCSIKTGQSNLQLELSSELED